MELVRAETAALGAEGVVIIETDFAITEMKSPRREACLEWQKTGHLVPFVVGVDEAFSQNHIATAFAKDRKVLLGAEPDTVEEVRVTRQLTRMKFRISAR